MSTAGSWQPVGRAVFSGDTCVGIASHPRDVEDEPNGKFPATYDEAIENARLMAAAPELLRVCQMIVATVDGGDEMAVVDAAKAAVAKVGSMTPHSAPGVGVEGEAFRRGAEWMREQAASLPTQASERLISGRRVNVVDRHTADILSVIAKRIRALPAEPAPPIVGGVEE